MIAIEVGKLESVGLEMHRDAIIMSVEIIAVDDESMGGEMITDLVRTAGEDFYIEIC